MTKPRVALPQNFYPQLEAHSFRRLHQNRHPFRRREGHGNENAARRQHAPALQKHPHLVLLPVKRIQGAFVQDHGARVTRDGFHVSAVHHFARHGFRRSFVEGRFVPRFQDFNDPGVDVRQEKMTQPEVPQNAFAEARPAAPHVEHGTVW
eukprot:CAMPEP_0117639602 /NCGR_PEP_ID=MMETSP0802-20121206/8421_1 /TAXON_ID=38833 /ORGANISM="Micromonas sp., Strain CCMP2099" /LENGTH=149 /DNA_ID=CAMNT_0005444559 /DNA_START=1156 /DNA_END=1602 /DNA_ORIENTATION=+